MLFTLRSKGPICPRNFSDAEKEGLSTWLTFELPYALLFIEGELPQGPSLPRNLVGRFIVESRQRPKEEIVRLLDISPSDLPADSFLVWPEDTCGRLCVSEVGFQLFGFIPPDERAALFDECLSWLNRLLSHYRRSRNLHHLRQLTRYDIFRYEFYYVLPDGSKHNVYSVLVTPVTVESWPGFKSEYAVANDIRLAMQIRRGLWDRLLSEARRYHAVADFRSAVINCVTALESLFKDENSKHLTSYFQRRGLPLDGWRTGKHLDSVSVCLNLLNLLHLQLRLDSQLTGRLIDHYDLRNNIVHNGTLKVREEKARQAMADTYEVIRAITKTFDFSVTLRFRLQAMPPADSSTDIIRFAGNEHRMCISFMKQAVVLRIYQPSLEVIRLEAPVGSMGWTLSQMHTVCCTYDDDRGVIEMISDDRIVASTVVVKVSKDFDASTMKSEGLEPAARQFLDTSVGFIMLHNRYISPEDLSNIDSVIMKPEQ
ncbi:MAG: hypothetical protein ACLQVF_14900 [Isosphaeraceae bacterium]